MEKNIKKIRKKGIKRRNTKNNIFYCRKIGCFLKTRLRETIPKKNKLSIFKTFSQQEVHEVAINKRRTKQEVTNTEKNLILQESIRK